MAAKINISVPDELQKRITALGISPSKLYQEAAAERADKEEALQKAREEQLPKEKDMNAIVERLRKEKAKSEDVSFDLGEKEGLAFAKVAGFDELKYAAEVLADTCDLAERDLTQDDLLGDYFQGLIDDKKNYIGGLSERWLQGWAYGVRFFWDKLPTDLKG